MAAGSWYRVAHCSESKWNVPHGKVLWWEGWSCPLPSAGPWNSVGEGLNSCSRFSGTMGSRLETGQRAVKSRGQSYQTACEPEELHKADTRIKNPQRPRREVKVCASPPDSESYTVWCQGQSRWSQWAVWVVRKSLLVYHFWGEEWLWGKLPFRIVHSRSVVIHLSLELFVYYNSWYIWV